MSEYKVELKSYRQLTDTQKEDMPNNGCGREEAGYLHVTHENRTLLLVSDAIEPEDARFRRDLSWIKGALENAYRLGFAAGEP